MTATQFQLEGVFNPAVLEAVRQFWFKDMEEEHFMLPPQEASMRWFRRNEEFDKACFDNFREQLEAAKSEHVSAADIITAAQPSTPLDWLSLILFLDQIPRNVFRDAQAKTVFTVTDPKALEVAQRAIEAGIPEHPQIRFRLAYRFWFYLPLEHSEDLAVQETSISEHEKMFSDIRRLLDATNNVNLHKEAQKCRDTLLPKREAVERFCGMLMGIVKQHKNIIDRFGRYPHRNEPLGRQMTDEEKKYLDDGGETFGSKKVENNA
ncbi:hypothetical protein B0H63DRAFT_385056 [Podospora didyma]|uniref:DUF924-domain-containing protein n=1 Tax=Podospora didyma TaxID=330526 RepID=A0AAE0U749_9PEZI|nr:hypothetical protein B0H63DRAFT_385056 [Podospora didyma]